MSDHTNTQLEPCPFCGSEAVMVTRRNTGEKGVFCGLAACAAFYAKFATVERWNTRRASVAAPQGDEEKVYKAALETISERDSRGNYTDGFRDGWKAHFDATTPVTPSEAARKAAAAEIVKAWLWRTHEHDQERARISIAEIISRYFTATVEVGEGEGDEDALVDEVQRRMDQVVEAAVEWHQAGREGGEWFDAAETLGAAIDSLLELRSIEGLLDGKIRSQMRNTKETDDGDKQESK